MEFKDIIGILIMIAAIAISIIKKKLDSDKKVQPEKRKVPDILKDFFPDMQNMINEEEELDMKPVNTEKDEVKIQVPKEELKKTPYFSYENLDKSSAHPLIRDKNDTLYDQISQPDEIEDNILDDFDARKAIIYSEILKRPEY